MYIHFILNNSVLDRVLTQEYTNRSIFRIESPETNTPEHKTLLFQNIAFRLEKRLDAYISNVPKINYRLMKYLM